MRRIYRQVVLGLALLALAFPAAASEWQFETDSRIVAIADIHGAYDAMLRTLVNAGVIDESGAWAGGDDHLVIVGDLLDRGPNSRGAMDLLMRLENEAQAAGGRVHVLVGNHEAMNLVGDLRYVSAGEYAAFAAEETAAERDRWFAAWLARQGDGSPETWRVEFDRRFPAGFFAHRRAFASDGQYGGWLLSKPMIVVINGTAFVHGGLSPMVADAGLNGVNGRLARELADYVRKAEQLFDAGVLLPTDNFYSHPQILAGFLPGLETPEAIVQAVAELRRLADSDVHSSDGPLWYRGNVACGPLIEDDELGASMAAIGANRVVIGHTPTPGRRVLQRLGGKVIEIDTGMLSEHYNGRGQALILEDDRVSVVAEDSAEVLTVRTHPRRVGMRPAEDLDAAALERLLSTGNILDSSSDATGRTIVTVSDGTHSLQAAFYPREGRNFFADAAAYRLDRLLGLDMVPVSVVREVGSREGTLQFLPVRAIDEPARQQAGRGSSAQCSFDRQWEAVYLFDALIYNEGRSLDRMLYSTDNWQLILIGHDRAFSTRTGRPRHLQPISIAIGESWRAALTRLDESTIETEFGTLLDKRRRRALLARRDELLAQKN